MRVAVIGAGVAGVATAAALSRSGHGVTVVERGDGLRASGLAINLWSNASRYLSISAEIRAFVLAALGLGAAWLIDLDLFGVLAIATRDSAIGVTVPGCGGPDRSIAARSG